MPAITSNTKLALNFQSKVDGALELRDYGNTGHIPTQYGGALLSVAQKKWGKTSLYFDGSDDWAYCLPHADWNFGTGNFTIDLWARWTALQHSLLVTCGGYGAISANYIGWSLIYLHGSPGNLDFINFDSPTTTNIGFIGSWTPTVNTWYHIAVTRSGNDFKIYVDGAIIGSGTDTDTCSYDTRYLEIGKTYDSGYFFPGYMDEIRISKGVARWNADFSGALPTAPYGNDANTSLLLHCNSYDVCPTPKVPTFVETAQLDTAQKKFGESSLLLDGNSDYVTIPDSADWAFGNGNFAIELWFRKSADGVIQYLFSQGDTGVDVSNRSIGATFVADNTLAFWVCSGTTQYTSSYSAAVTGTAWHHYALVRNGNTMTQYIDGTASGTLDVTGITLNDSTTPFYVGSAWTSGYSFNGHIDAFHIIKGTALYTAAFTAPTTPPYNQYYSRKAGAVPGDDADLTTVFTTEEDYDVKLVDADRVNQFATATNFSLFQFKDVIPGKNVATLTWTGQSDVATSDSTAYLQAYNRNTTTWVNVDTNTTTAANTNFTLTGVISGLTNYLDADGLISCRVYQEAK